MKLHFSGKNILFDITSSTGTQPEAPIYSYTADNIDLNIDFEQLIRHGMKLGQLAAKLMIPTDDNSDRLFMQMMPVSAEEQAFMDSLKTKP